MEENKKNNQNTPSQDNAQQGGVPSSHGRRRRHRNRHGHGNRENAQNTQNTQNTQSAHATTPTIALSEIAVTRKSCRRELFIFYNQFV
jgi:hypothetical protein